MNMNMHMDMDTKARSQPRSPRQMGEKSMIASACKGGNSASDQTTTSRYYTHRHIHMQVVKCGKRMYGLVTCLGFVSSNL